MLDSDLKPGESATDSVVRELFSASARWAREALRAWNDDDGQRVAVLAPLAVELLSKALLWGTHPTLLAPTNDESSLMKLAVRPDIATPGLRTVDLRTALARVESIYPEFPLSPGDRVRLVNARNGAVHIAAAGDVEQVLQDCLNVLVYVLKHLGKTSTEFFSDDEALASALASKQRESLAGQIELKLAKARMRLTQLETQLGGSAFQRAVEDLEEQRWTIVAEYAGFATSIEQKCPACSRQGRLLGSIDAEGEVDWDVEPLGGGQYASYAAGAYWTSPQFTPGAFQCPVCRFQLDSRLELAAAGLRDSQFEVGDDELDEPGFDLDDYMRSIEQDDY